MKEYKGFLVDDELNIYSARTGAKLKAYKGSDGYMQVAWTDEKHKLHHQRVHVIYAHLFIPNPNGYKYINHIDSDKTNNSLDNLEWCTNSYNVQHSYNSGNTTDRRGVKVYKNGEFYKEYISLRQCGEDLNLPRHKISRILKGELRPNYYVDYLFEYA